MKTILQIAEEEGALKEIDERSGSLTGYLIFGEEELERFAARIQAQDAELCATISDSYFVLGNDPEAKAAGKCENAIRNSKD